MCWVYNTQLSNPLCAWTTLLKHLKYYSLHFRQLCRFSAMYVLGFVVESNYNLLSLVRYLFSHKKIYCAVSMLDLGDVQIGCRLCMGVNFVVVLVFFFCAFVFQVTDDDSESWVPLSGLRSFSGSESVSFNWEVLY